MLMAMSGGDGGGIPDPQPWLTTHTPSTLSKFPSAQAQTPAAWQSPTSPIMTPTPRAQAPLTSAFASAPSLTAPTFTSLPGYQMSAQAPQVSTDPLNNVPQQYRPDWGNIPQVGASAYQTLGGSAPTVNAPGNIMEGADTAMALMDLWGEGRVGATTQAAIDRGMGRSGVALAQEDATRNEVNLEKANLYQGYVEKQAEMQQTADLANQQSQLAYTSMLDASRQYSAMLEQERSLANQAAAIQVSGQQAQYSAQLAQISQARDALNAQMQQTQQQMLQSASEFDRSINLQRQVEQWNAQMGAMGFNEGVRQFDMGYGLQQQQLAASQQAAQNDPALMNAILNRDQFNADQSQFYWNQAYDPDLYGMTPDIMPPDMRSTLEGMGYLTPEAAAAPASSTPQGSLPPSAQWFPYNIFTGQESIIPPGVGPPGATGYPGYSG